MKKERIKELTEIYRDGLLNDTIPFWIEHGVDREFGGLLTSLARDGSVVDTDKSVWVQGRFIWLLSTLFRTVEKRQEWIDIARGGVEFLRSHCFDTDGRMFFTVTRDGKPLRKRRYLFSECFAVLGLAAYGHAAGDGGAVEQALELFELLIRYYTEPGLLEPKTNPATRSSRSIGMPMMIMSIARELLDASGAPLCTEWIDRSVDEIRRYHVREEPFSVLETVGPAGEFQDTFTGRMVTPGHIIEAGWFILDESRKRGNDPGLTDLGRRMIDWSWDLGWDWEFGGIIYYRDVKGLPCTEYWHDMKFWWQQNEAIIATLLAWDMTGDERYAELHELIHEWTYERFPDPEYGEWYGYLHRDGSVSTSLKGNIWKGPFHLPRMQWYCWKLLEGRS